MVQVLKEFVVVLPNRPGSLGSFDTALGRAGVDVMGFAVTSDRDRSTMRFVCTDAARAQQWLQASGHGAQAKEVLAVPGQHKPGFVGSIAQRLGEAGVNIEASYPANLPAGGHVVLAVDDLAAARKALAA